MESARDRYAHPRSHRAQQVKSRGERVTNGFFKNFFLTGTVDTPFLLLVLALLTIGVVMMFSASYTSSYYKNDGDSYWFFKRQAAFAVLGIFLMLVVSRINYRKYAGWAALCVTGVSLLLLVAVLFTNSDEVDFKRWLNLGGFSFQPSDVAKFAMVLFLAYNMSRQYELFNSKRKVCLRAVFNSKYGGILDNDKGVFSANFLLTCWYAAITLCFAGLIYLENHLSCTLLVLMIGMSMMWLCGVKKKWFALVLALVAAAAVYVIFINPDLIAAYAGERIVAWRDKTYEPRGARWQVNQSLYAIASGGPFGLGFGNSRQKNLFVSEPQNDFVFAIVCEELGFVGAAVIIALFAALVCRGFIIASRSKDIFGALLAMGFVSQIGIQMVFNIMVVTDTIPNTGISLPFFSYGGTALVMLLVEMGVVLSVSRNNYTRRV